MAEEGKGTKRLGAGMITAAWVMVLGLLTLLFGDLLENQRNPNRHISNASQGTQEVVLQRNRFGHYVATAQINGHDIEVLLDTGASDVAIPDHVAKKLRLERGAASIYNTANGPVRAFQTVLDTVQLGDIVLTDVRASINPGFRADHVLLGMSFLKHVELTQRGDTLILR